MELTQEPMSILLRGRGFLLTLMRSGEVPGASRDTFVGTASLRSTIPGAKYEFQRDVSFPLTDLVRLSEWIDEHIRRVVQAGTDLPGEAVESATWTPIDLSMQVRLSEGEVVREDDLLTGSFGVRVALNLGIDPDSGMRLYGGLEGEVDIQEILAFRRAVAIHAGREQDSGPSS